MTYNLECERCEFAAVTDREARAYTGAKHHEAEHPDHVVFISEVPGRSSEEGKRK